MSKLQIYELITRTEITCEIVTFSYELITCQNVTFSYEFITNGKVTFSNELISCENAFENDNLSKYDIKLRELLTRKRNSSAQA